MLCVIPFELRRTLLVWAKTTSTVKRMEIDTQRPVMKNLKVAAF